MLIYVTANWPHVTLLSTTYGSPRPTNGANNTFITAHPGYCLMGDAQCVQESTLTTVNYWGILCLNSEAHIFNCHAHSFHKLLE